MEPEPLPVSNVDSWFQSSRSQVICDKYSGAHWDRPAHLERRENPVFILCIEGHSTPLTQEPLQLSVRSSCFRLIARNTSTPQPAQRVRSAVAELHGMLLGFDWHIPGRHHLHLGDVGQAGADSTVRAHEGRAGTCAQARQGTGQATGCGGWHRDP